jgi:hypothetical protein
MPSPHGPAGDALEAGDAIAVGAALVAASALGVPLVGVAIAAAPAEAV